jgi:hypothetical protein
MFYGPINETYFGKTSEILDIEKTISIIRKKYTTKHPIDTIINDPRILELGTKISKAFGFRKVYFGFDPIVQYNCYTVPVRQSRYGDLSEKYTVSKDGIKYKPDAECDVLIVATTTLFFDKKLTDGEVMATILHEIGHSFTEAVVPIELGLDVFKRSLQAFAISFMAVVTKKAKNNLPVIEDIVQTMSNIVSTAPGFINKYIPETPITKKLLLGVATNTDKRRYIDEKFADQFAAMYGYGTELSSVLSKIDYTKKTKDPSGEINKLIDLTCGLVNISTEVMFSYTPMLAARMKSSIQVLEHEIKTNKALTPELREDLEKQISDINLLAKQYSNINKTPKYEIARKAYFQFMFNNIKEGDFFSKFITNSYNLDKVDSALEKNKK